MDPSSPELDALVVLGCKVHDGAPSAALLRRLERAAEAQLTWALPLVVMSGGQAWPGGVEAEVMAAWWSAAQGRIARSTNAVELVQETRSLTTRGNAFHTAALLRGRGLGRVGLVTCDYHMRRAARLFREQNLWVLPLPAAAQRTLGERLRLAAKERVADFLSSFGNVQS